jgi:hypothetical protein
MVSWVHACMLDQRKDDRRCDKGSGHPVALNCLTKAAWIKLGHDNCCDSRINPVKKKLLQAYILQSALARIVRLDNLRTIYMIVRESGEQNV